MQKTALITGASSGFGLEFSKLLAADGYNLVLIARNRVALKNLKRELETTYSIQVQLIIQDLSDPQASQAIFQHLKDENLTIDVLINNAGFGNYGSFAETNLTTELAMIQVHTTALIELTKLLLPSMIKRKQGKILNMASLAGLLPGPSMAIYYATKAFVVSFSQSLSKELEGSGVTVTVLCPGPTATNFQKVAFPEDNSSGIKKNLASSSEVIAYGYKALQKGQLMAIPGIKNRLLIYFSRLLPLSWVLAFMQRFQED